MTHFDLPANDVDDRKADGSGAWDASSLPTEASQNTGVSFHAIGTRAVLFDSRRQRLYVINRSAGFMWCCLAEGYSPAQTAKAFALRSGCPLQDVQRQLAGVIEAWREIGVLARKRAEPRSPTFLRALGRYTGRQKQSIDDCATDKELRYRLLDTTVRIVFRDKRILQFVKPALDTLAADPATASAEQIEVVRAGRDRIALIHRDSIRWTGPRAYLVSALYATLVRIALECSTSFPAIHAGAVRGTQGVVLIAGPSGCGKSTIASALLASRCRVLCDDTIVLDMGSMRVRPVSSLLCLKSGAWPVVDARLPRLRRQPGYQRPDGKLVRFLPLDGRPATVAANQRQGYPVQAIVFPRYRPGQPTSLIQLDRTAALNRLCPCVDPIGHRFRGDDIERLIRWVGDTDCYRLNVDSLDDAVSSITNLL
jgi:hypothetical protein